FVNSHNETTVDEHSYCKGEHRNGSIADATVFPYAFRFASFCKRIIKKFEKYAHICNAYRFSDSSIKFYPGGWLAIVAGNELFIWKYISAAQNGVNCRVLANRPFTVPGGENTSLLSGLSRRVSNLFSIVASSGGLGSRLLPTRGENTLQGQYAIESFLPTNKCDTALWRAVDMAIRWGSEVSSDSSLVYLLAKPHGDCQTTCLISLTVDGTELYTFQAIRHSAVIIEWPFKTFDHDSRPNAGGGDKSWELCLPALSEWERTGRGAPAYPCLLASVCRASLGQVVLVEETVLLLLGFSVYYIRTALSYTVLTGNLVAKLDFGCSSSGDGGMVSALLGCGSVDSQNLFVYATSHRGLFALIPSDETFDTSIAREDDERSIESSTGGGSKSHWTAASQDTSHPGPSKPNQDRGPLILVRTQSQTRLVTVRLNADRLIVCDASVDDLPMVKLSAPDLTFVTLCEVARIFWMGFEVRFTTDCIPFL
ncbi:unnamed protein product, partial [Echinostoma caproni]|uniref:Nucleoporin_N domain-containing protein n=1 Tax=Echinostoma caproni TaxID=27848 RepID=A0A183B2M6_9TREM